MFIPIVLKFFKFLFDRFLLLVISFMTSVHISVVYNYHSSHYSNLLWTPLVVAFWPWNIGRTHPAASTRSLATARVRCSLQSLAGWLLQELTSQYLLFPGKFQSISFKPTVFIVAKGDRTLNEHCMSRWNFILKLLQYWIQLLSMYEVKFNVE